MARTCFFCMTCHNASFDKIFPRMFYLLSLFLLLVNYLLVGRCKRKSYKYKALDQGNHICVHIDVEDSVAMHALLAKSKSSLGQEINVCSKNITLGATKFAWRRLWCSPPRHQV